MDTENKITFGKGHFFSIQTKMLYRLVLVWESQTITLTIDFNLPISVCVSCNPKVYILPQETFSSKLNHIKINLSFTVKTQQIFTLNHILNKTLKQLPE